MLKRKVFEYRLMNAWGSTLKGISISDDEKNSVCCMKARDSHVSGPYNMLDMDFIEINDDVMKTVKHILDNSRLYGIRGVEMNKEVMVLDGYRQEFYISNGSRQKSISASNLQTYRYDFEKYPKASSLMKLLLDLADALVPAGVSKEYFQLEE